jgi:hypothetical protein
MHFQRTQLASLSLRAAVAFSFAYPAIDAYFNPNTWIGYLPQWATALPLEPIVVLHIFGAIELVIASWLMSGRYLVYPAAIATIILLLITGIYWQQFTILFRDLALALASFALVIWYWPPHWHATHDR